MRILLAFALGRRKKRALRSKSIDVRGIRHPNLLDGLTSMLDVYEAPQSSEHLFQLGKKRIVRIRLVFVG